MSYVKVKSISDIFKARKKINILLDSKNPDCDRMKKSTEIGITVSASTPNPFIPSSRTGSWICDADLFASASVNLKYFTESKEFTSEYS